MSHIVGAITAGTASILVVRKVELKTREEGRENSRDRQRQAEACRERQRQAEKCRER